MILHIDDFPLNGHPPSDKIKMQKAIPKCFQTVQIIRAMSKVMA